LRDIVDNALSWESLVEALPDGTALLDEHGVMRYVNELLTVLTGFSRGTGGPERRDARPGSTPRR